MFWQTLIILWSSTIIFGNDFKYCNFDQCNLKLNFTPIAIPHEDLKSMRINATLSVYSPSTKTTSLRIQRSWSYCNNIPFEHQEKECTPSTENMLFSIDDLNSMVKNNRCLVGHTCEPDECYGTESSRCMGDFKHHYSEPGSLRQSSPTFDAFYHSCNQYWGCEMIEYEPKLNILSIHPIKVSFQTPNGENVEYYISESGKWKRSSLGYYTQLPSISINNIQLAVPCISNLEGIPICLVESKSVAFKMSYDKTKGLFRNMVLTASEEIGLEVPQIDLGSLYSTEKDLNEALLLVGFVNDQMLIDVNILKNAIYQRDRLLSNIIGFVGKIYPDFIASIVGLEGITPHVENGLATVCPCSSKIIRKGYCEDGHDDLIDSQRESLKSICRMPSLLNISSTTHVFESINMLEERLEEFKLRGTTFNEEFVEREKQIEDYAATIENRAPPEVQTSWNKFLFWLQDVKQFLMSASVWLVYINIVLTLYLINLILKK